MNVIYIPKGGAKFAGWSMKPARSGWGDSAELKKIKIPLISHFANKGGNWTPTTSRAWHFQCQIPHPPPICMNIKRKDLPSLYSVID
jgi:hypothetical protein